MKALNPIFAKLLSVSVMIISMSATTLAATDMLTVSSHAMERAEVSLSEEFPSSNRLDFEASVKPATVERKAIALSISGVKTNAPIEIAVYNTIGNVIYKTEIKNSGELTTYSVVPQNKLKGGVYFVALKNGQDRITKRIVVR